MFPNMNPKNMGKMMKRLGINVDEIDASEVVISLTNGEKIRLKNPQVVKMNAQGQDSFQITGQIESEKTSEKANDSDVQMVSEQAGVSIEVARKALEASKGDIAKAILDLSSEEKTGD